MHFCGLVWSDSYLHIITQQSYNQEIIQEQLYFRLCFYWFWFLCIDNTNDGVFLMVIELAYAIKHLGSCGWVVKMSDCWLKGCEFKSRCYQVATLGPLRKALNCSVYKCDGCKLLWIKALPNVVNVNAWLVLLIWISISMQIHLNPQTSISGKYYKCGVKDSLKVIHFHPQIPWDI